MNSKNGIRTWLQGPALALLVLLAGDATAAAPVTAAAPAKKDESLIRVEVGTHTLVRESAGVKRVAVGDPNIADINVINGREVLVSGKKLGVTSLLVWPKTGSLPKEYRVRVGAVIDPDKAARPDPELAGATVEKGAGLGGRMPNLLAYRRAKAEAGKGEAVVDKSVVEGEFQVLTQIKIAEVNRTTAKRYGLNLNYGRVGRDGNVNFNSLTPGDLVTDAFQLLISPTNIGNNETIGGTLSILESRGIARVLAEPSLTAMSGQTASFLAGGEFPVPVSQTNGVVTIEYKEFGIRLPVTPTVLSKDRIALRVAPEVSDLDFSAGIELGGDDASRKLTVPALTVRRTETTIELGDGESFVISGLVSNNLKANVDKVPGLADIPIIGAFFKSVSYDRDERELIMIVTPHLVKPLARGAKLPALPGEKYDEYRPGFGKLIFGEKGDFDESSGTFGFSK
ncbi:pilus assembly protein CpaC [Panacagrimonas perspica]|uniref:Pilus assembly protein CpaC n=1 Tax=Panacagrimonas perspica TaxID=381431 RepID=A0A4V3URY4_9GAMM|nr:type II and III secretion system protein family protein [Panacagrimonas perspica]TDU24246.1 pilus assembly protein CpaC [Panacagrimonas perspica]THD04651.1 hypothetical protein B1810_04350 [Panacagrimonas perspica]